MKSKPGRHAPKPTHLSSRETEVLIHLARAKSTTDIAKDLSISEKTVRTHIQNMLRKLAMHSRLEAVVHAYKTGLLRS